MKHVLIQSGHFLTEWEKVSSLKSQLIVSAVNVIESAYWLIGGDHYQQALVLLDNAIELVLKGELERIHPVLVADHRNLGDFETLKSVLKDAFRQHPAGAQVSIADFDFERTIYFETAFDRVAELYPSIRSWRKRLLTKGGDPNALHALRNGIMHYKGDRDENGRYVAAIVEVALPFLEELLKLITQQAAEPIRLSHLLKEWIYREVEVAKGVLSDLQSAGRAPEAYAIAPLAHHILWSHTRWPSPQDDLDMVTMNDEWYDYAARQKFPSGWDGDLTIDVDCPICHSFTPDNSHIPAKALINGEKLNEKIVAPEGFICYICGFQIEPTQTYLAKHFVPAIDPDKATEFLKDFGFV